jgi:uncharacterized OB-fold protein
MADDAYGKPLPEPGRDSRPYWEALGEGRLVIQQCGACGKLRHYPRPVCDACYSMDATWRQVSGRGAVHSWTIAHHPFHPGFKDDLPYVLATVDLEEGVRMIAQLRGVAPEQIAIGLRVEVGFERATEQVTLPVFTRRPR